jgi:septation ring formation regulator EzrA
MQMQSNIHFYVNWAKERLDEMEAVLTSLESKVGGVQADARDKANKALADLRKSRDIFRDTIKKQAEANEAAWTSARAKLEPEWNSFEAEVKKYVESFGKQVTASPGAAAAAEIVHHQADISILGLIPTMFITRVRL